MSSGSAQSLTGRDPCTGKTVRVDIDCGRIVRVEFERADSDVWLAPGFVDLQINGYGGHDFNSGNVSVEDVLNAADAIFATGTTTFLPTVVTATETAITQAITTIADARNHNPVLATAIPCIHVEGPFISPKDGPRGAHRRDCVRPPDIAEFDRWQAACGGLIGLLTLSPHWPGACEFIARLVDRGVLVAIGHTDATPEEITAAVDAGARLSTHLGNAAAVVLQRHPNFIWTQLADDRLTATFIGDGQHLPTDTLQAMIRAKGVDRSVLISDTIALAGLPPGIYDSPIGGRVEITAKGGTSVVGTPYFAGAARPLSACIANAANLSGITLCDAVWMATQGPARFLGNSATGRSLLASGAPADLVQFTWSPGDHDLKIARVLVGGNEIPLRDEMVSEGASSRTRAPSAIQQT